MTVRIAVNGFGRIGRLVVRALYEMNLRDRFELVAINSRRPAKDLVHLFRYDSVHGPFVHQSLGVEDGALCIGDDQVEVLTVNDPAQLPWAALKVDLVLECTGKFNSQAGASKHLSAGAQKVLLAAPGGSDIDATIVYGVNESILRREDQIVSNASCTTNCLAPLVKALHNRIGIEHGLITTIHAVTGDQNLVDGSHQDPRRARSAMLSMVPTKTGAAAAVGLVMPELKGKLDGLAVRVPTLNVSLVDLTFTASQTTSAEAVNAALRDAAEGSLKGVLAMSDEPLVSVDFNHHTASSIVDTGLTRTIGDRLVKIMAWYDNEWGFSCRMLDTAWAMMQAT